MIRLNRVCKSYGKTEILKDITLEMEDCSIYGLIGYNGAGKTTLLNIVSGLYRPTGGEVLLDVGEDLRDPFDDPLVKRSLFYVTDNPYYFPGADLVTMRDFYKGFYPNWSDNSFSELVKLFGLDPEKRIGDFSKGMKRQAAMIMGLASRPRYLLLDESFDGLDPNVRTVVSNLLAEYIAETESTVVAASHNLYELENICDTVGMLNGKQLLYSKPIEEIKGRVKKYRAAVNTEKDPLAGLSFKFLRKEGNIYTFQSEEPEEKLRDAFGKAGELFLFEAYGMTLNEIFIYETKEEDNEIEGIFAK
ncbi:MAG: ABC transporter ATP-binding protein [Ruminococcaceae bacterium]|nr:ABC transporter ATP-binding protein [Oscillospiraceae bacterium]